MATISHGPSGTSRRAWWLDAPDMWASLAITAIWLVVLLTAIFGPDIRSIDVGGNSTTIPSTVAIALFALFGTRAIARYGFHRERREP